MSLDLSAERYWPQFNSFTPVSQLAINAYAALARYDVLAGSVAACVLAEDLPPKTRIHAAQLLAHTLGELRDAADMRGGIDVDTAQDRVDAMARVCLHAMAYARSN